MLAWPAFSLLKNQYPDSEITALVPKYTAPLAEQCEWIDKILIDERQKSTISDIFNLSKKIGRNNYDVSISLFSEIRTSLALALAKVKTRIGPATKTAQVFLNKTLKQKRSQSLKPESEYNLDLIKYYFENEGDVPVTLQEPPFFVFDQAEINALRKEILNKHSVPEGSNLIIIHPGSGGSSVNLSIQQYAELALAIDQSNLVYFIITAGPGEVQQANQLSKKIQNIKHHIYESTSGIIEFCKFLNICDVFIGGSTGPLHISGALDIRTVAFYSARKSATALRYPGVEGGKGIGRRRFGCRAVDRYFIDLRASINEHHSQSLTRVLGTRQQDGLPRDVAQPLGNAFGDELGRHKIWNGLAIPERLRRSRADGRHPEGRRQPSRGYHSKPVPAIGHTVYAREDDPGIVAQPLERGIEPSGIGYRGDAKGREADRNGARVRQFLAESSSLSLGPRHDDAFSQKRFIHAPTPLLRLDATPPGPGLLPGSALRCPGLARESSSVRRARQSGPASR